MEAAQALRSLLSTGRFQDALEQYRELADGPESRRPDVQLLAATAATRLGDLPTGRLLGEQALEKFRTRGDWDGSMRTLNLLGAIHWEHGQVGLAEVCFGEALRLARQLQDSLMLARASNNLASVAHLQGRFDQAAELFRGALLAYHRLGDRRGTAETYHNLGFAYRQNGEWRQAEDAAAAAVRHAEVVGEPALLALAIAARAELKIERDDPELAARELERAEHYAAAANDEIGTAEVRRVQALNALHRKDWTLALSLADAARSVALKYDSALLAAEGAGIAARALKALGRAQEAVERRSEAVAGFRQLGATTLLERLERELEG